MSLRRNLVFAFWDAEEKGTLGTQYFVEHPLIPLEKIKVVFNMDMIGRDASFNFAALRQPISEEGAENKVMLFYSAQAPVLKDIAAEANRAINLHLLFDPNVFFTSGSDHVNFHSRKVPVVFYFTGFHTDYTSANDTADKINFKKLTRITQHIANFSYRLANAETIPEFDSRILTAPEVDFIR
jgi:Zn-dependent M28 family amino/carboxypeptidase